LIAGDENWKMFPFCLDFFSADRENWHQKCTQELVTSLVCIHVVGFCGWWR